MYPLLLRIPKAWDMPGMALLIEILVGLACLLAWLALHLRGRRNWLATTLNLAAFLVGLHFLLSWFMTDEIKIYSFGVIIIIAFFVCTTYLLRQTRQIGIPDKKVFDWAFWMLVVGILGSRLLYAFLNYELFRDDKLLIFKIWNGGLVWYGGLIPAAIVGVWLLTRYKLPVLHVADAGAAALMFGLGIGRWACLMAGDDYGRPTDAWFGIRFYSEHALVAEGLRGVPLHPTQLYMSVNCLWLFFILEWIRQRGRFAGQAFAWMLILYAVTRFAVIEPFRGDFVERNPEYENNLAVAIKFTKGEGTPALHLERGTKVTGTGERTGQLLSDLDLPAGTAGATVHAISDQRAQRRKSGRRLEAPGWEITGVDGLPAGVSFRSSLRRPRGGLPTPWYASDLPVPPGYVSTSQWISIAVVVAGVLMLVGFRKYGQQSFRAAVRQHAEQPATA
ncbi:MAG: prolipoprotein diacylglyceryl transferase [Planctomycetota bacterium]